MDSRSFWDKATYQMGAFVTVHGGKADVGFHEIPERFHGQFPDKEHLDPIMDITLANDGINQALVSELASSLSACGLHSRGCLQPTRSCPLTITISLLKGSLSTNRSFLYGPIQLSCHRVVSVDSRFDL